MLLWVEKYCDEGMICSDHRSMPLPPGSPPVGQGQGPGGGLGRRAPGSSGDLAILQYQRLSIISFYDFWLFF